MSRAIVVALTGLLAGCGSSGPARAELLSERAASSDRGVLVEAIRFAPPVDGSAQGTRCEIDVIGSGADCRLRKYRPAYFSGTGERLAEPMAEWGTVVLGPGERKTLSDTCPFRTARRVQLELR